MVYRHGLTRARDAVFELVDALLLSGPVHSFAELSQSPVFRRQWPSVYEAVDDGWLDLNWLRRYLATHVPDDPVVVFALDGTTWPHPQAETLADQQYVYNPSSRIRNGKPVVVGHPYSVLSWVEEAGSSWALPVNIERIPSQQSAAEVGVAQVQRLCRDRAAEQGRTLPVITGDAKYGTRHFLGPLRERPCALLVRLRCDRVLRRPPGPYSGRGRLPKHGPNFAFKRPDTWGAPDAEATFTHSRFGQVRLRRWDHLHMEEDADTPFSVILSEIHLERERPAGPLWLAYQGPAAYTLPEVWEWYQRRWPCEPATRFRKQRLYWTLPHFQKVEMCDRWTQLVALAEWQLFLARPLVQDCPLPWQLAQKQLTPGRVLQSLGGLFSQIATPAHAPKQRGNAPGWTRGRPRRRPERFPVVRKGSKKPLTA